MRIAVLDRNKCRPKKCGYLCEKVCPMVRMGDKTIEHEASEQPVISEDMCSGCGICVKKCPYGAITIVNLPEELEDPVHQYGKNGFRLFGLPVPKPKSVVGIIGPNGIGKSTCIKILGGQLVPNLGRDNAAWKDIIDYHRGQEIQAHLERVAQGGVRISLKPQNVDAIPHAFDGTVGELLSRTAELDYKGFADELEVTPLEHKRVSEISGGELQRVAIVAALSKDADIYLFDEPTSYLDVRQRLRMTRVVRKLAEGKAVMVIEHDLAVLDYLSDFTHVMFGQAGAYGIVSTLKGVRVGINEFLDGFLRAENMRFRPNEIKFAVKPPSEEWRGKVAFEFPSFTKSYEGFSVEVSGGQLRKGEVIGVLGPNAIGKSTFMKVLAAVEKPDSESIGWSARISYKPQYVRTDFEGSVRELVQSVPKDNDLFQSIIEREVAPLYDNMVPELSGGELQRVSIALALARDADICLLDEPSAFLDVEQRVKFAEVIRKVTEKTERTTLVIDHDITLQDYVSDRLMVFEGEPGVRGKAHKPEGMRAGMNRFLRGQGITYRRDPNTGRPRANKPGSQKVSEQKSSGQYYYTSE
ncbi:MAG: ribosome biogenesis/translation initiation ATPase RLI [Candidatus Diapherotrites archaeon]|nr:ribosome biogenesis/translation initiation ATPase RLI [Candidatus Diapherotrites archaeon]